jgi:3-hydroxyisobutyrate dehydrogenase
MGSEMAFNLFSKTFAESPDTRFVVCDALPTSAIAFRQNFVAQFSGAHVDIVLTPKE